MNKTTGVDQRTKNRIKEHGGHWKEVEHRDWVLCIEGPAVLMKCPQPCNWAGWISYPQLCTKVIN